MRYLLHTLPLKLHVVMSVFMEGNIVSQNKNYNIHNQLSIERKQASHYPQQLNKTNIGKHRVTARSYNIREY